MESEWDPKQALLNVRKHGVHFADALTVLEDNNALSITEESADGEERSITLGADMLGRILVLISACPATPNERRQYAEGL